MASYTTNYNLKKPAPEDFVNIGDINTNMDIIDGALAEQGQLINHMDLDFGLFTDGTPVLAHNTDPYTHSNIALDGNETKAAGADITLEEHIVDEGAHTNLNVDGNVAEGA